MAQQFTFEYLPDLVKDSKSGKAVKIYHPYVPIQISHKGFNSMPFYALVDSGSDRNLFPAVFGLKAGISVRKEKSFEIAGIGESRVKAYKWKVNLSLMTPGMPTFGVEVDFSYEHNLPLLGRNGFFNLFRSIEFREKRKLIELRV